MISASRKNLHQSSIDPIADSRGVYLLVFILEKACRVSVGRLGEFDFPAGRYVYVGSAMSGFAARVGRHLRREKTLKWHIDYLLRYATHEAVLTIEVGENNANNNGAEQVGTQRLECRVASVVGGLSGAVIPAPRFGASDCRCRSHLIRVAAAPEKIAAAVKRKCDIEVNRLFLPER